MRMKSWRTGLLPAVGLLVLVSCASKPDMPSSTAEDFGFFASAKGRVSRINRSNSWFELKRKGDGSLLTINYDATTVLLNFKGMIEITKDQPVEVTYMPGSEPANRAISIRKLQPDECN